jgi:lipoic acid synthetase
MVTKERLPKPEWLKVRFPAGDRYSEIKGLLRQHELHTVCEEAKCPNIGECFNLGEATFMILGDVCTRACGFCAVTSGKPGSYDLLEPVRLAQTVETLGLDYVVITSVNRDDLPDGGSEVFAACLRAIHYRMPHTQIEVLTPDWEGDWENLRRVVEAGPVVYNHNVETVPRLSRQVRSKARYDRSLELLSQVKKIDPNMTTKSGIMVGLGETLPEIVETMEALVAHEVDLLTVGQYLQPDTKHLPVKRYYHPDEFAEIKEIGERIGFKHIESGPFVRSSYHAGEQSRTALAARDSRKDVHFFDA